MDQSIEEQHLRNELDRTFLDRYRTEVQPWLDLEMKSRDMMHDFGKTAFRTAFLLNGGALLAFPAFAELIGNGFRDRLEWSIASIAAFVLGLVLIALASLCAGFAYSKDTDGIRHIQAIAKREVHLNYAVGDARTAIKNAQEEIERRRTLKSAAAAKLGYATLALWSLSILAFVSGAVAAAVVMSAPSLT
jgi:hypothetical protein